MADLLAAKRQIVLMARLQATDKMRLDCKVIPAYSVPPAAWLSGRMLACHAGDPGSIPEGADFLSDREE